ncbi:MAG: substrate-binding domain-containing protein [Acidobacteriaceae bacterium]|nr:substrate-binding domain-containing protein [Acidobacteriaceae bacterium]
MFISGLAVAVDIESYIPQNVAPPSGASYWHNGAITIVGYNDMNVIFDKLNALFLHYHPGFRFNMRLSGTAAAPAALAFGLSAFAPMGAEFSVHETTTFRAITGSDPVLFRIAHCSLDRRAKSAPIGIFVNTANPLESLSAQQVAQMFTTGQPEGDLTSWGQLGLSDHWREKSIHPVGIMEEAAGGLSSFMLDKMRGLPFAPAFGGFPQSTDVVNRVAEDADGIGFASGNLSDGHVKLLKIDGKTINDKNYPYDRFLLIYVREMPSSFEAEYLRFILSKEGQSTIANATPHYRPLTVAEVQEEMKKLEGLTHRRPVARPRRDPEPHSRGEFCMMGPPEFRSWLEKANAAFGKRHLEFRSKLILQGTAAALDGISVQVATLAITDRAAWPLELRPFRQLQGYEPADIEVARIRYSASEQRLPPGIYVNDENPVQGLTLEQLKRIFVRGSPKGDITQWGQLGLPAPWANRRIHVYGLRDDGSFATAMRHEYLDSLPFTRAYEPFLRPAEAAKGVADDVFGIALLDAGNRAGLPDKVRILPLAGAAATSYDVGDGRYPLSKHVHVYLNRIPGDPLVREYLQWLLSSEGQQIIATERDAGVMPLTAQEIPRELSKLR